MEEPWEVLDTDDSDIPSLLRPCKRLHRPENPISTTVASPSEPLLRPCSRNSSQTLVEETPVQRRIISGPAGAIQSAMLQRARDREKENLLVSQSSHFNPVSTQEYIRRAVENAPEFDDDFSRSPWLSALQFIGTVDGVVPSVPLSYFNQSVNVGKVDRVVAVIKSRTYSILGGLMVTLKDPTGTIGASVHHKLLSESQFSQDFAVGSVLILEKVAVFSPTESVHYLNIMPRNLVKVFKKDDGPLTEGGIHAHSVKYVTPGKGGLGSAPIGDGLGKLGSPEKTFIPETGNCEEIMDGMEENPIDERGGLEGNHQLQNKNTVEKEPLIMLRDAGKGLLEEILSEKAGADQQAISHNIDRGHKAGSPKERRHSDDAAKSMTMNHVEDIQEDSRIQKQKQLFTASLPLWTDEQLEELFAGHDDEDGGSLF